MGTALIITLIALLFSSFFSGMEIAFLSSNKLKVELEKKQHPLFRYVANLFTRNPGQYITTILVSNNVALVVYSLQITLLLSAIFTQWGISANSNGTILLETLIATIIIIFTAEFIPKAIVRINPNFYFKTFYLPVYFFYILFFPVVKSLTLLSTFFLRIVGVKLKGTGVAGIFNKTDLVDLVEQNNEIDTLQENEKEFKLFQNALEFSDIKVRECMVPRIDMEAIDITAPLSELEETFIKTSFSRIPLYEDSIDNIVGYVNSKSLFRKPNTIREILLPIDYVPESLHIQKLLSKFIKSKRSIAIVIDEFGGTAGMVTLEDLLEEIFGEIEDEHDSTDLIEKKLSDNEYILSCRLEVEYLNDKYGFDIPVSDEYDTLAGYIIYRNDGLPKQGAEIKIDDKNIKILKTTYSKLDLIKLQT